MDPIKAVKREPEGSDHCPAMKGIETYAQQQRRRRQFRLKRPLPRNEGD